MKYEENMKHERMHEIKIHQQKAFKLQDSISLNRKFTGQNALDVSNASF